MNRVKKINGKTSHDNHHDLRLSKGSINPKLLRAGRTDNKTMVPLELNGKMTYIFLKKDHNAEEVKTFYRNHLLSYCGCQTRKGGKGVQPLKKDPSYPGDPEYLSGDPSLKNLLPDDPL